VARCEAFGGAVGLAALGHIPRVVPEHPIQLLDRQPAIEASARVLLGSLKERRTEALVQACAALLIGGSRPRLQVVHVVQRSGPRMPGARPSRDGALRLMGSPQTLNAAGEHAEGGAH